MGHEWRAGLVRTSGAMCIVIAASVDTQDGKVLAAEC